MLEYCAERMKEENAGIFENTLNYSCDFCNDVTDKKQTYYFSLTFKVVDLNHCKLWLCLQTFRTLFTNFPN